MGNENTYMSNNSVSDSPRVRIPDADIFLNLGEASSGRFASSALVIFICVKNRNYLFCKGIFATKNVVTFIAASTGRMSWGLSRIRHTLTFGGGGGGSGRGNEGTTATMTANAKEEEIRAMPRKKKS